MAKGGQSCSKSAKYYFLMFVNDFKVTLVVKFKGQARLKKIEDLT